ncbi:hypothetical protein TIFTF001_052599, partial [Ficus carica]
MATRRSSRPLAGGNPDVPQLLLRRCLHRPQACRQGVALPSARPTPMRRQPTSPRSLPTLSSVSRTSTPDLCHEAIGPLAGLYLHVKGTDSTTMVVWFVCEVAVQGHWGAKEPKATEQHRSKLQEKTAEGQWPILKVGEPNRSTLLGGQQFS